ncbi:MAG: hypothetical protein H7831_05870 [Magnetococcus sp. WYHC-3]
MFREIKNFLAAVERAIKIGFPVFNEFLCTLVGLLGLATELLGFSGEKLARLPAGLRCIQQCYASADEGADGEDAKTASGN